MAKHIREHKRIIVVCADSKFETLTSERIYYSLIFYHAHSLLFSYLPFYLECTISNSERSAFLAHRHRSKTAVKHFELRSPGPILRRRSSGYITFRGHLTIAASCMAFHTSFDHRLRGYCGDSARSTVYRERILYSRCLRYVAKLLI